MAFVDTYATRHLPRVVGAPPLPKLTGEEILPIAVAIRKQRDLAAYWNSITTLQLQQFIGTQVTDAPPHAALPGQTWWDDETRQLYVWTGTAWVPASCASLDDDDKGAVAMSDGPPCDAVPGTLWWSDGDLYVLTDDGWVAASCCGGAVALGCEPPFPAVKGMLWWSGQLYVFTGCEWVSASCEGAGSDPGVFTEEQNGLVPAPGTLPKDVMLEADGSWGYPSGRVVVVTNTQSYVVQPDDGVVNMNSGTVTTDVTYTLPTLASVPNGKVIWILVNGVQAPGSVTIASQLFYYLEQTTTGTIFRGGQTIRIPGDASTNGSGLFLAFRMSSGIATGSWGWQPINPGPPLSIVLNNTARVLPGTIGSPPLTTVANLPAVSSVPVGTRIIVTDATLQTGSVGTLTPGEIQGGGSFTVPLVVANGRWRSDFGQSATQPGVASGSVQFNQYSSLASDLAFQYAADNTSLRLGLGGQPNPGGAASLRLGERVAGRIVTVRPTDRDANTNGTDLGIVDDSVAGVGGSSIGCRIGGNSTIFMNSTTVGWAGSGFSFGSMMTSPDNCSEVALACPASRMLEINSGNQSNQPGVQNNGFGPGSMGYLRLNARNASVLPAASSTYLGARGTVLDATSIAFGDVVTGGGSNIAPVWCDGTNWRIG